MLTNLPEILIIVKANFNYENEGKTEVRREKTGTKGKAEDRRQESGVRRKEKRQAQRERQNSDVGARRAVPSAKTGTKGAEDLRGFTRNTAEDRNQETGVRRKY